MARREDGGGPANGGGAAAVPRAGRGAPLSPHAPSPAVLSPPPGLQRSLHGSGSPGSGWEGSGAAGGGLGLWAPSAHRAGQGGAPGAARFSLREGKGRGCGWGCALGPGGALGLRGASSALLPRWGGEGRRLEAGTVLLGAALRRVLCLAWPLGAATAQRSVRPGCGEERLAGVD